MCHSLSPVVKILLEMFGGLGWAVIKTDNRYVTRNGFFETFGRMFKNLLSYCHSSFLTCASFKISSMSEALVPVRRKVKALQGTANYNSYFQLNLGYFEAKHNSFMRTVTSPVRQKVLNSETFPLYILSKRFELNDLTLFHKAVSLRNHSFIGHICSGINFLSK